jgi:hypothetical protein
MRTIALSSARPLAWRPQVTLGQKGGQATRVVSRCLWDTSTDSFASETYENETVYCVCQVYGVYYQ